MWDFSISVSGSPTFSVAGNGDWTDSANGNDGTVQGGLGEIDVPALADGSEDATGDSIGSPTNGKFIEGISTIDFQLAGAETSYSLGTNETIRDSKTIQTKHRNIVS